MGKRGEGEKGEEKDEGEKRWKTGNKKKKKENRVLGSWKIKNGT